MHHLKGKEEKSII